MFIASLLLRQDTTGEGAEVLTGKGWKEKVMEVAILAWKITNPQLQTYLDTDISKMEAQQLGVVAIVKNW